VGICVLGGRCRWCLGLGLAGVSEVYESEKRETNERK